MGEKVEKSINLIPNGIISIQAILLVIHYAFEKTMPKWVLWFPFICFGTIIAIMLLVGLIILIITAIAD